MATFINSSHFIANYQNQGDPLAEAIVSRLREKNIGLLNPLPSIRRLAKEGDDVCQAFMKDAETVPAWVDFDKINLGAKMAARNIAPYLASMLFGALVQTYIYPPSAAVFSMTGRLGGDTERRLFETADLFLGVLKADSLKPCNETWEMCVRIRLLHTMVRLRLMNNPKWQFDELPVNQKETSVATWAFGTTAIANMKKLGAVMSAEEEDGFYMLWRYVCRLEGADEVGSCATAEEQKALEDMLINQMNFDARQYHAKRKTNKNAQPDTTQILMKDLLDTLAKSKTGLHVPRPLAETILRLFHEDGAELALDIYDTHPVLTSAVKVGAVALNAVGQVVARVPFLADQVSQLGYRIGQKIVVSGQKGVSPDYQDVKSHA